MPSTQLFPEVIDGTTLGAKVTAPLFLPIGVEGQMDNDGDGDELTLYRIDKPDDANKRFGAASSLAKLVNFIIDRGAAPVFAIASNKGSAPVLSERQAAWQTLEADEIIRLRMTDSITQADLVAHATSCDNANLLNHKQVSFSGVAEGQVKSAILSVATAMAASSGASRAVLMAPGIYDLSGTLKSGLFTAAASCSEVAKNPDLADDLDTASLLNILAVEKDANGNDLFREIVVGGAVVNDFEDLLQGGVSPVMRARNGGVAISHLRPVAADPRWDSLMTRLIVDQLFILVRDYAYQFNSLRKANTQQNRELLASGIEALLRFHNDWVKSTLLGDGSQGYGVTVTSSPDNRQQIIHYEGDVIRGTSTILVQADLTITV